MAWFDRQALNPGVRRREVLAWAGYDFANSGYTTVVLPAVYNAFFVGVVAGNANWATLAWTLILGVSNLLVMLTMPAVGALADRRGAKKALLAAATLVCIVATAGLAWTGRGDLALAGVLIILSNYAYSMGETLVAAFLPELSRPEALGKVSGWGWSFGYLGGMLTLGLSLGWVMAAQAAGEGAEQFVPATMWITAGVYLVAAVPLFLFLRERAGRARTARGLPGEAATLPGPAAAAPGAPGAPVTALDEPAIAPGAKPASSWRRMLHSLARTQGYPDFRRLLWTGVAYQAGIAVVVALAAVYAEAVMGFRTTDTMLLIFLVNIAAALGAFGFGYLEDRIGHKRALALTLIGWLLMVGTASAAETAALFWVSATLAGLCMGSSQSCGRALVGQLAPAPRMAEFYGLWSFATRLAAIIGPLTYGLITWVTSGNHRLAILLTGLFFVAGLILLAGIKVERGTELARSESPAG